MLSTFFKFSSWVRRPTRYDSVGCDEENFSSPEEFRRLLVQRGGGGTMLINNTPSASLPTGSSVVQSTALPSLGTAWHLANPL